MGGDFYGLKIVRSFAFHLSALQRLNAHQGAGKLGIEQGNLPAEIMLRPGIWPSQVVDPGHEPCTVACVLETRRLAKDGEQAVKMGRFRKERRAECNH